MIKQNLIASSKLREMIYIVCINLYSLTFSILYTYSQKNYEYTLYIAIKAEQMLLIRDKKQIVLLVCTVILKKPPVVF